jgi:predicted alpha/beta superfamily hydrolase
MKKSFRFYAYCGLCGLLSVGILKASGAFNKLYAFSHSLDLHADEDGIKKEAEKRMREEAKSREDAKYWKEYYERQAREKKEKEEKQRKRDEEEKRRKDEEKKAWEDHRRDLDKRAKLEQ